MSDFAKALGRLRPPAPPRLELFEPPAPLAPLSIAGQLQFLKGRNGFHAEGLGEGLRVVSDLPGEEETTDLGRHLVVRTAYAEDHHHGRIRLSRFGSKDLARLIGLLREKGAAPDRSEILFLDTEATGLQGGAGICPFLIGGGYFEGDAFHVVQYFIRDFDEEPSMLRAFSRFAQRFRTVVTYNGRSFDVPLVESRFMLARMDSPFESMPHFDLLPGARRLWRNGHGSCRLAALEREIIGFMRGPDVSGALIPRIYFDFLERGPNRALRSVFTHNVDDVVSLAALVVAACDSVVCEPAALDEPLDLYSLARIVENTPEWERAAPLYRMALKGGLPEPARMKAIENLITTHRRAGEHERAFELCRELIGADSFSMTAVEGAAIYYERIVGDRERAMAVVEHAISRLEETPQLRRPLALLRARRERLQQKTLVF